MSSPLGRRRSGRILRAAVLWAASFSATRLAHADGTDARTTARRLGQQGAAALAAGDWQQADADFRKADALFHAPTLLLGLARAESHEGKVVESWEHYHRILEENVTSSPVFAAALRDAAAEIAVVERRRARLTIVLGGGSPTARVMFDDAPFGSGPNGAGERYVDAGHHTIRVTEGGVDVATHVVDVIEGSVQSLTIQSETLPPVGTSAAATPAPPPRPPVAPEVLVAPAPVAAAPVPEAPAPHVEPAIPPAHRSSAQTTIAIASFVLGGVGLVTGAVAGGVAVSDHSSLATACPGGACGASSASSLSSYHTVSTVSTVGFIVGGVGVAGGAILLLTRPHASSTASSGALSPYIGLGTAGVTGSF